jgi:hypothetical protein
VQDAADAHGVTVAGWLRHAIRQVSLKDFPASWREAKSVPRSHESGCYDRRFQLRLDPDTQNKLETLKQAFDRSAEVIRQLIAQATPEDFPQSWQLAAAERRPRPARAPEPVQTRR